MQKRFNAATLTLVALFAFGTGGATSLAVQDVRNHKTQPVDPYTAESAVLRRAAAEMKQNALNNFTAVLRSTPIGTEISIEGKGERTLCAKLLDYGEDFANDSVKVKVTNRDDKGGKGFVVDLTSETILKIGCHGEYETDGTLLMHS
ncbi:MAG: hypothetical protein JWO84_703 [Parcubacteria group bacterium]|nr:hypothetical protein [Parcubacteria group bacterium]